MKISLPAFALALTATATTTGAALASSHCTRGRLFVADIESTTVEVFDLDGSNGPTPIAEMELPGLPGRSLWTSSTNQMVIGVHSGDDAIFWKDGDVRFVRSGVLPTGHEVDGFVVTKEEPTLVDFTVKCTRPIHYVGTGGKLGFFCDGAFEAGINTTVWVVDENRVNQDREDAVVFSRTLQGTHHGLVAPHHEHTMVTVATPERIAWDPTASDLPAGFEIYDENGNVIHGLHEEGNPHKSCSGFHGEALTGDSTFSFACNQEHGGVLVVTYGTVSGYASRAISYPSGDPYDTYRTGTLKYHYKSNLVIGNFGSRYVPSTHHLVAFNPNEDLDIAPSQMEPVGPEVGGICSWAFEYSGGEFVFAWLPNGRLRVYAVEYDWMRIAEVQVLQDMKFCNETVLTPGHGHAYILQHSELVDVDVTDLANIQVSHMTIKGKVDSAFVLGIARNSATVAGVPKGYQCPGPHLPLQPSPGVPRVSCYVVMHHEPEDLVVPGSKDQSKALLEFRSNIATVMNIPMNRVFVVEVVLLTSHQDGQDVGHKDDSGVDSDYVYQVVFSDATSAAEVPQTSAEELLETFTMLVEDRDGQLFREGSETSRIAGGVLRQFPAKTGAFSTEDSSNENSISAGGTAGIIIMLVAALGAATAAVIFYNKHQHSERLLEKARMKLSEYPEQSTTSKTMESVPIHV